MGIEGIVRVSSFSFSRLGDALASGLEKDKEGGVY